MRIPQFILFTSKTSFMSSQINISIKSIPLRTFLNYVAPKGLP